MSRRHILKGQLRIPSVPANLSTYLKAHAIDGSAGTTWEPLSGFGLYIFLRWREVRKGRDAKG